MGKNHSEMGKIIMNREKDENNIAVIPYVVYDALMERFERTQKNLRFACMGLVAVCVILSLFVGIGATHGNRKNS